MTNEEKFVNELIGYIFAYPDDDYMTMECLCRKLVKYKLMRKVDGYYIADRKTENSSEIPNNCEHITEDGVTCAKYPACDDCFDNPLNKVKGSERLVKGSEQTEPTISKMEQVDKDINVRSKDEPQPSKIIEAYAKGYKDGADAVKGIKDKQIRACDICKYEIGETCTHPKVKTMKKEWATFEGDLWGEENTPKWCPIDKDEPQYDAEEVAKDINRRVEMVKKEWNTRHIEDEPQTDGILFKGNLKEGEYKLIKTTNGWVLEGNDIAYYGEPQTERSSE